MSRCSFIYEYGGPRCPYRCLHEAEFRVYGPGQGTPRLCCGEHLELTVKDFLGLCVVAPVDRKSQDDG